MAQILVDTSATYALLDRSDDNHARARAIAELIRQAGHEVLLTNLLVAEGHALILVRLGRELARRWLQGLRWPIERVTEGDEARAQEIISTYPDKDFSYTDATSFAVMERLGLSLAFAFDRRFEQFEFQLVGKPGSD